MSRGLQLAVQFLTRIPVGTVPDFKAEDLSRSAAWFPLVGALIGALAAGGVIVGARVDSWLGALVGLLIWVGVTGALHLDGLADLADALGAAHRDRSRFLAVLKDPHVGAFGVIALLLALLTKLILLGVLLRLRSPLDLLVELTLTCAWARFGALVWSGWLPALAAGAAERFAWRKSKRVLAFWAAVLLVSSFLLAPATAFAVIAIASWGVWLKKRLGGMTGDCLGAGVEIVEAAVLFALVILST